MRESIAPSRNNKLSTEKRGQTAELAFEVTSMLIAEEHSKANWEGTPT